MRPAAVPVKAPRRYDASGRRERARRAQSHVLHVAEEMFLRDGYAGTTVAAVAAAGGVSVETIYKTFGGKPGLIRAIQQAGLAGAGPRPAPERSDEMSAGDLAPRALLRNWASLTMEVMPRVAPIVILVRSAGATDPDMATLLDEINDERLRRMRHNARRLADRGSLRDGVSTDVAADIMFAYTAPDLYDVLVGGRGWTPEMFADFIFRGLCAELLE